ncbi:hypothetical protein DPV78_011725 [Talaromyces pinophilus]|nr:hypothetical protein DPV78_011725 [Talaromyces pinophilus]
METNFTLDDSVRHYAHVAPGTLSYPILSVIEAVTVGLYHVLQRSFAKKSNIPLFALGGTRNPNTARQQWVTDCRQVVKEGHEKVAQDCLTSIV